MKENTYSVIQVAEYILSQEPMSNLRLQKILYFVQAFSLIETDEPLFYEEIEAWEYGPVVKEAYNKYKYWGALNISTQTTDEFTSNMSPASKDLIDEVLEGLRDKKAFDLVDLTHSYEPWINSFENPISKKIKKEEIKRYHNDREIQGRAAF